MATNTMSPMEHPQATLDYLVASDPEFERGDVLQGNDDWSVARARCVLIGGIKIDGLICLYIAPWTFRNELCRRNCSTWTSRETMRF